MRKLASLEVIEGLSPIPDAAAIELAHIKGWKVVVKKGEFKVGDHCVYFEIDSFLPELPIYEFLRSSSFKTLATGEKGFRIKTLKLRGQISQGLALPLYKLLSGSEYLPVGFDLSDRLGVKKWEPPVSASLGGDAKGNFPSFLPKTDEERIQNLKSQYSSLSEKTYTVTEKLDGTSFSAYRQNDEHGVCSRNLELKETEGNVYWRTYHKYKVKAFLLSLPFNAALQGEIVGGKIQGNPYKLGQHQLFVFNLINLDTGERLDIFKAPYLSMLKKAGIDTVPLLEEFATLPPNVDELIQAADGSSVLNPQSKREGLVYRSFKGEYTSFKAISNQFLLKQKD